MRVNLTIALVLATVFFLAVGGCRDKRANLQDSATLPDKTLFENGLDFLDRNQYIKARLSFQTLINAYEESPYLERSKYYIAYSFMREGGIENLLQAEQAFRDFRLFFPTSEYADNAQAFIVEINMHMMHAPSRDQKYSRRAETEVSRFIMDFPNSPLLEEMKLRQLFIHDVLASSAMLKGEFYHKRKQYKAASFRLKESVSNYPNFGCRDKALFLLADSMDHLKNFDESSVYYAQLAQGYPFSEYFEKAKERLKSLEKPIPEVDAKLAAANQKTYYKGDSVFSSPFKVVFGAIGLGGEDQVWETMGETRGKAEKDVIKVDSGKATSADEGKKKKKDGKKKGKDKGVEAEPKINS